MIDTDKLANQIHAEVFDVAKTGFPLNVFPDVFQKIIFELVNYENFNLEYTATIMLSAFATAIGNTYHVRIKGKWVTACFLYMILVGRPGLGKTPPLGFLYFPIRDYDKRLLEQARREYDAYAQQQAVKKESDVTEPMEKMRFSGKNMWLMVSQTVSCLYFPRTRRYPSGRLVSSRRKDLTR